MKDIENLAGPVAFDSNILVYLLDKKSEKHKESKDLLDAVYDSEIEPHITHQNILETLQVLTRKYKHERKKAQNALEALIEKFDFRIVIPQPQTYKTASILFDKVKYPKIFDLYFAATALDNRVSTILTENTKDFDEIDEITAINPFL